MPISVSIDIHGEEDGFYIEDIGMTPKQFVQDYKANGGVFLEARDGLTPFIPESEIVMFWFDDGSSEEEMSEPQTFDLKLVN